MSKHRVLVDMSATIIHHGHVRLLKSASELGSVFVALTSDEEIKSRKGYTPELAFEFRKEILLAIRYVDSVIESPWLIDDEFMTKHNMQILVHGDDNSNIVRNFKVITFPRTPGISSSEIRKSAAINYRNR